MDINLHDVCEVTLTEDGARLLNARIEALYRQMRQPFTTPVGAGHTYRTQLWCLFEDFGSDIHLGSRVPFELCQIRMADKP